MNQKSALGRGKINKTNKQNAVVSKTVFLCDQSISRIFRYEAHAMTGNGNGGDLLKCSGKIREITSSEIIFGFIFRIILAIQYTYIFIDVPGLCLNLK